MAKNLLKFRWQFLLGIAAALVTTEVWHVVLRGASTPVVHENTLSDSTRNFVGGSEFVESIVIQPRDFASAVLVLGNLGAVSDGEIEVVVSAIPVATASATSSERSQRTSQNVRVFDHLLQRSPNHSQIEQIYRRRADMHQRFLDLRSKLATEMIASNDSPVERYENKRVSGSREDAVVEQGLEQRVYFLQTARSALGEPSLQTPVQCRMVSENHIVRIYLDQKLAITDEVTVLVQSIREASESPLSFVVESMVGIVDDIDRDGRLSIVLTSDVERLGSASTPVKGITRSSDFVRGLDRPASNQADVIFISPNVHAGEEAKAVLAHEWCHAAVFSRRADGNRVYKHRPTEDDWLNEAIAHVVEVRASGSWSNLEHRIRAFESHPESSPLNIRDYYHSEYWRHDGCRGAAFLFLQWCVEEAGDSLIGRLLDSPDCNAEALEEAMGTSFAELFGAWTESLAQIIADRSVECGEQACNPTPYVQHRKLDLRQEQSLTLRLRGTSSAYLLIESDPSNDDWQLTIRAQKANQIQASLVPVRPKAFR